MVRSAFRRVSNQRAPSGSRRRYPWTAAWLESEEVADGIVVDYDAEGRIVGVEILDASKRTGDPEALTEMSFELPERREESPQP